MLGRKGKNIKLVFVEATKYIWFESAKYDNVNLVVTSGKEYARIMIDKILLAQKRGGEQNL